MIRRLKIVKICIQCGEDFIAKTTVTRFCSKACNGRFYKDQIRRSKVEKVSVKTVSERLVANAEKLTKEYLSVNDTCKLLGVSKPTIYTMINSGRLRAANLNQRSIRIHRTAVESLFTNDDFRAPFKETSVSEAVDISQAESHGTDEVGFFSIPELMTLFDKSRPALYTALARAGIPKIKIGKEVFFAKAPVRKLLAKIRQPVQSGLGKQRLRNSKIETDTLNVENCYTIDECVTMFGKDRSLLYGIFNRRMIPKVRDGHRVLLSGKVIDRMYKAFLKNGKIT